MNNIIERLSYDKHFRYSTIKNILRILAGIGLCFSALLIAGVLLIVAEILGFVEEL